MKRLTSATYEITDLDEAIELYYRKGWTDGLPVVPPTPERVKAMLSTVKRDPEDILGAFLPMGAEITVEKVAF